jgi:DNA gyrase subunit A
MRFQKISQELLADIEKETVDFVDNYDGSFKEPSVLPTKIPSLLINGSSGIAVGMATNIPPHNLGEIIDGLVYLIDNKESASDEKLLEIVKGPDFPTAGIIMGNANIKEAYKTGKGVIRLRAKVDIEDSGIIAVSELPYNVNKARLIEKIALLTKEKKIDGIQDIRDESDRRGMRIAIKVKKGVMPEIVENNLYRHTSMQSSFGINNLSIVGGKPQLMNLRQILQYFIEHRVEVVYRRTRHDLNKARARMHILEGIRIAISNIDKIVEKIKSSPNVADAKAFLKQVFDLSSRQSQAILEMRLQRLTGLERGKIETEYRELKEKIAYYEDLLSDQSKIFGVIKDELALIRDQYADERKTKILENVDDGIEEEDLITEEAMVVTMSYTGYIKRISLETYKTQNRGGRGKMSMTTKEDDFVQHMFISSTHDNLLIFTSLGKAYKIKVFQIPQVTRISKGRMILNLLPLQKEEKVIAFLSVKEFSEDLYAVMITKKGIVKKTNLSFYKNPRKTGTKAIVIDEGDQLVKAKICCDDDNIFISTKMGMALKFPSQKLRSQGRTTRGCTGIRFKKENDTIVGLEAMRENQEILTITERGYGKRSNLSNYRLGSRGNMGVTNLKIDKKNGLVVNSLVVDEKDEFLVVTNAGKIIRLDSSQIRKTGRVAKGVKIIQLNEREKVVSIAKTISIDQQ